MFLQVIELKKSFGSNHVLRGISFGIEKGESLVLLGGSGTGKSVLLRHLVGLTQPDSGQVLLEGEDMARMDRKALHQMRQRFGMSFQEGALFDNMTAFENVAFPLRRGAKAMSVGEVRDRVAECLELVGMPGVAELMPSEMSGGMRRRVGFARAIALKPEILLFDEPTTGLDPIMTSVINDVIIAMREQLNATTITITHDIGSARAIATRVAMMYQGGIIRDEPSPAFFECDHPVVRQFIEGRSQGPATEALLK